MSERQQFEWFLERVGKRIYRSRVRCKCDTCVRVGNEGLIITDEMHANYLFDIQNELGIKYRDTES